MSTQTGISANEELKEFFGRCREDENRGKYRMMKIVIANEELALEEAFETSGDFKQDWDKMVLKAVDMDEPCFLLYRLDEKDGTTFRWLLISWSPETSSVRNKMLYASTKATLRKEFGTNQISDDLYGNVKEDISFSGYLKHVRSAGAPGPLTREEEEREEVKMSQTKVDVSVDSKHQTISKLAFPMTDSALEAIGAYGEARIDYLQLSIDVDKEIIVLERQEAALPVADLPRKVPEKAPRYHLFRFKHTHEGDYLETTVFIYTLPGQSCSIKERMLYASCSNAVVETIEAIGVEVSKKVEVDSGSELTEEFLQDEIHPKKNLSTAKFAKPKPPSRGGNRRMTKVPTSTTTSS